MPAPTWENRHDDAQQVLGAVLAACDPGRLIDRAWQLNPTGPVTLVGVGKASVAMTRAVIMHLDRVSGLVLGPDVASLRGVRTIAVDHPLATDRNVRAAEDVESLVTSLGAEDTLLLVLSGGASAHLTLPARCVRLDDVRDATDQLMRAGATIDELNTVRKHVERLKGGRLGALAHPARVHTLALSDVVGDRLDVIGSGPAMPDPTTYADALAVLHDRAVDCPPIESHLRRGVEGLLDETPKPDCVELAGVQTAIIGSRATALAAAADWAAARGFVARHTEADVTGEAAVIGAGLARSARTSAAPGAWIIAGETTVSGIGPGVRGGPAQELALAGAFELGARAMLISFATDGIDGPTDAAGACVDSTTIDAMDAHAIDARAALASHDSHTALDAVDALLHTGPTGTNVNDLAVLLVYD